MSEKYLGYIWAADKQRVLMDSKEYSVNDIVLFRNTRGNIEEAMITKFQQVDGGAMWFHGINVRTKKPVWYGLHLSHDFFLQSLTKPNS